MSREEALIVEEAKKVTSLHTDFVLVHLDIVTKY